MSRTAVFGILLFLIGHVLSLVVNLLSSEDTVQIWYREHRLAVLAGSILIAMVGLLATARSAVDEARREGDPISGSSIAGSILSSAVLWGVVGGALGMALESFLWPHLAAGSGIFARLGPFLAKTDVLRVSCCAIGVLVGTRLRFADFNASDGLALTGGIAGGVVGLAVSDYFTEVGTVHIDRILSINAPPIASAAVAASLAAITGVFKPGYDRRCQYLAKVRSEEKAQERSKREEERTILEMAQAKLRKRGYELRTGDPKSSGLPRSMVEILLAEKLRELPHEERSRLKKEIHNGSIDEVIDSVVELGAREDISLGRIPDVLGSIRSSPFYGLAKLFLEGESGPIASVPSPPYIVTDDLGREVCRFTSLRALDRYVAEL